MLGDKITTCINFLFKEANGCAFGSKVGYITKHEAEEELKQMQDTIRLTQSNNESLAKAIAELKDTIKRLEEEKEIVEIGNAIKWSLKENGYIDITSDFNDLEEYILKPYREHLVLLGKEK